MIAVDHDDEAVNVPTLHLRQWVWSPGVRSSLGVLLLYTLVALVIFHPVPFRLNTVLAGFDGRDGWEHAWWLWFAKRLTLEGRGLSDLYLLNHPAGLQHPYQWTLTSFSLLASLVGLVLPPAATFNVMALGSFALSGLAAYHLCRELTGRHLAAVVGGAIFAFCPNRLAHALGGWLPQLTVFLYPWFALLLIRLLAKPTAARAVVLGVLAAAGALVWPMHIAYFMLPLALTIVGAELLRLKGHFFADRRGAYLGLALLISLIVALPFFIPLVTGRLKENLSYLSTHGILQHSTELLAFFTPSPYHPILGRLGLVPAFARRVFDELQTLRWDAAYVGLIPALLALWGLLGSRPRPWRWVVLAATTALLALGPVLMLAGEPVEYTVDGYEGRILLPYAAVRQIPLLDWGRTPGRLNTTAMLGVAALASFGVSRLLARMAAARWKIGMVALAIIGIVLFEYVLIWPFPAGDASIPEVIQHIASESDEGALLHVPMDRRSVNNRALFFQTTTGRPIVGGVVLRTLPAVPPWQESIEGLVVDDPDADAVPRPTADERLAWLAHLDIDWVILDRFFPEDEDRYRPFIEHVLGPATLEDDTLTAYRVPDEAPSLERSLLYTFSGEGWHRADQDGTICRRWMENDGQLYIYAMHDQTGVLRFSVDSHLDFPLMEVYQDDRFVDSFVVGDRTSYTTRAIALSAGMNVFRFRAPQGCEEVLDHSSCWREALLATPADSQPPCDARTTCRTFVFDTVSFVGSEDLSAGERTNVTFGDEMRLRGWELEGTRVRAGGTLTVTLSWEAIQQVSSQHVVFVHLLSNRGDLVAQHDNAPVGSMVPRESWPAGATLKYPVSIELPADLEPGTYRVVTGVYRFPSVERLPIVSDGPNVHDNTIELGRVEVVP